MERNITHPGLHIHLSNMKEENFLTEINNRFIKTDLCNSFIKSIFSIYLLMLDYRKLDFQNMFILTSDSCYFEIISQTNDSLQFVFEFWKFQVNIYIWEKNKYIMLMMQMLKTR